MKHWVAESRSFCLHYDHLTNEELCKLINLDFQSEEFYDFEDRHKTSIHVWTLLNFSVEREADDAYGDFAGYLNTWHVEFHATSNSQAETISEWIKIKTGIE